VNEFADMSAADFKIRHSAEKHYKAVLANRNPVPDMFTEEQVNAAALTGARRELSLESRTRVSVAAAGPSPPPEGQWFLASNSLTALSEQELVSCDTTDDGCNGGVMDNAWGWLVSSQSGKIPTEASYPYVSGNGEVPSCGASSSGSGVVGATISSHQDISQSETQMATWMSSHGPLSIVVDATSWQTYTGGVMTNCISSQVDHAVLAVGYDNSYNPPYWIIKNSWGADWGESGYIRVQKGTDQCLITTDPCSAIV
jgi:hypothetical protein